MPRMIPAVARFGANSSERRLFSALEGVLDRLDWVVFHSLVIRQHLDKLMGEADFLVVAPGKGIVVVEAKAPRSVEYRDGEWTLDGTPSPHKSPLEQVDGAVRSIRSFLLREGAIDGDEPIARLLWFTSIGRHHFGGRAPSDLTFFEWELAWADDLARPAALVEKVLDEHIAWHAESDHVNHDPAGVTREKVDRIVGSLTRDFDVAADDRDARREATQREVALLAEQRFALELVGANRAVYFDGPAGSGKSYLVAQAAIDAIKRGERTLLTCWNLVMADRLRADTQVVRGSLAVADLGAVMLRVAGLDAHPADATNAWFQEELPALALRALAEHPERGGYRNVVVDEFQDIAGNPLLVDVLVALAAPDAHVMLAGDERQQIMRPTSERVDPFEVAKSRMPDLVLARIRRNCRQAPALVAQSEKIVGRPFGFAAHRMPPTAPGGAERVVATRGNEAAMLAGVLKLLSQQHSLNEIVVLSPWGARSLAARIVAGDLDEPAHANDVRWLRANLGDGAGRARFGSISKLKGIEVDAVVVTDVGADARDRADAHDLDWDDLLYVGLSRAKHRAVVLEPRLAATWSA
ncbi:MAG: NERD domain-containing protein [Microbacterium sp.]|uniref:nuclease-related domain-containing DEAD/DEAH box helicase n=1 Tax=Microbacterium sp. TaxID=51671 RepID=UPI0039E6D607